MVELRGWIDAHALWIFVGLLFAGAIGAQVAYARRGIHDEDNAPIPMLRKRTASALLGAAAVAFALLSWAMLREGRLVALDTRVYGVMRDTFGSGVLQALAWITHLGDDNVLIAAALLVAVVLAWRRHALLCGLWVFTLLGNGLLIRILKDLFQRTRPVHEHGYAIETGYSFPSGHAAGSMAFYGMLAYVLLVVLPPRWHRRVLAIAVLAVLVIGSSRIVLQVHFLSDVFAGYALALGWLALCIGAAEWLRTVRRRLAPA